MDLADPTMLREHLLRAKAHLYAVMDGAQFDDLPAELAARGLSFRPLYLDRGESERERAALQLVSLGEPSGAAGAIDAVLELTASRPATVFWECPAGPDAIYRHLRTINMALIPKGTDADEADGAAASTAETEVIVPRQDGSRYGLSAAPNAGAASVFPPASAEPEESGSEAAGETHEFVLFRHGDANVMAQVLPALNGAQFARLLGPATAISFAPDPKWVAEAGFLAERGLTIYHPPRRGHCGWMRV